MYHTCPAQYGSKKLDKIGHIYKKYKSLSDKLNKERLPSNELRDYNLSSDGLLYICYLVHDEEGTACLFALSVLSGSSCSPDVQFTLTPVSSNHSGLQSQALVKQTADGNSSQVCPTQGLKGQKFLHDPVFSSSRGLWLPQSTTSPLSLRKTGISTPHRVTIAHIASGWFVQFSWLQGFVSSKEIVVLMVSLQFVPAYPAQHRLTVLFLGTTVVLSTPPLRDVTSSLKVSFTYSKQLPLLLEGCCSEVCTSVGKPKLTSECSLTGTQSLRPSSRTKAQAMTKHSLMNSLEGNIFWRWNS